MRMEFSVMVMELCLLWSSFHLILAITPPLEVLLKTGSLLGDEQTQLDLRGPLELT